MLLFTENTVVLLVPPYYEIKRAFAAQDDYTARNLTTVESNGLNGGFATTFGLRRVGREPPRLVISDKVRRLVLEPIEVAPLGDPAYSLWASTDLFFTFVVVVCLRFWPNEDKQCMQDILVGVRLEWMLIYLNTMYLYIVHVFIQLSSFCSMRVLWVKWSISGSHPCMWAA